MSQALLQWWQVCGCGCVHMCYTDHIHKGRCWDGQWFGLGNSWASWFSRGVGPMGHSTELGLRKCHRVKSPLTCQVSPCVCTNCRFGERSSPIPFCNAWKNILLIGLKLPNDDFSWLCRKYSVPREWVFIPCSMILYKLGWCGHRLHQAGQQCLLCFFLAQKPLPPPKSPGASSLLFLILTILSWEKQNRGQGETKPWEEISPKVYTTAGQGFVVSFLVSFLITLDVYFTFFLARSELTSPQISDLFCELH